ncbi:MAG: helix-turn-helix transcriptional regulator [Lachnospiraceae bacterium]|nr:helix-turn-helix transcriptional regulator [Lachnospiraceae bacterium]
MKKLLNHINAYLKYLNDDCGLYVSIHFGEKRLTCISERYLPLLLKYNYHRNPYCIRAKRGEGNLDKCIYSQKRILESQKQEPFCRICHAGVCEYIYPISERGHVAGFAAVSGYTSEKEIPVEMCDTLIPPLAIMVEQFLELCQEEGESEYNLILQYLNEYHTNITLADLCEYLGRSKSYISHMFKKANGGSIREYCNNLKLEDARRLLGLAEMSVTQIAYEVGFHDVSYFINLFKKKYGISPLQYRKKNRE